MDSSETISRPVNERRREQRDWYFYDWANSAFSTTVVTVIGGPYLTAVTRSAAGPDGFVNPLGIPVSAGAFFPYVISLSVFLQVILLPVVGAIADRSRRKKELLALFAYAGALATMGMYLIGGSAYLSGGLLFLVANLSFGASIVVYNSFLPEIAEPEERDRVSSRGWAVGYLGGGLLLAANLALFSARESFGLSEGHAARISLLSAGAWWALFAVIPLRTLRSRIPAHRSEQGATVVTAGFRQLLGTLRGARSYPQTLLFLVAYLLYNDGIQTVITLSATYGGEELDLGQSTLISAILMVQFVAFLGALLLGALANIFGAKRVVLGSLILWTAVIAVSYSLQAGAAWQFYLLAAFIGIVLGGSQALSRSLFSHMIPPGQEAEYFSLYEISERGTSWLGPLLFGLTYQITGSYRSALASLVIFFVAGFLLLAVVNVRRAITEVGNQPPERV
ncbi:MAG: MFS transporter [Actinobacteria bacterium]|nr:MFS transporter [Actinomycetota bacterium]